jgi:hypothetical protein
VVRSEERTDVGWEMRRRPVVWQAAWKMVYFRNEEKSFSFMRAIGSNCYGDCMWGRITNDSWSSLKNSMMGWLRSEI